MARLGEQDKIKKQAQAREMYTRDFSITFISEVVGVKPETIRTWAKVGEWEDLKRANAITPSHIQNMILQCAEEIKEGRTPKISPDQLAKLASAYEKLSDKRKHLGYMIDAFSELRNHLLRKAQEASQKTDKQKMLSLAQEMSPLTDEIINLRFKEITNS
ncbi:MAG: hypothetical protein K2Q03_05775, partial [Sphingobacteriaceae bacterium]|nr:hypothetical protein [Sphingobacteriaceae bacterium]